MNGRVLIVGSLAFDDVKTPVEERRGLLGGAAVYASVAASCLAPADIVGIVGDDFSPAHLENLNVRGVDTSGVEIVKGGKTFSWGGEYLEDMNQRETHFTHLNVFEHFNPTIPEAYRDDAIVLLANIDPELQLNVLEQVRNPSLVLCDTMNFWIESKKDALIEVLKRTDVLLMNDQEAKMFSGTSSLPKAARALIDLGIKWPVITKGEHGVKMFSDSGFLAVPSVPLEDVVDPTGAGDSFSGGFAGYIARTGRIDDDSIRQAIVVGSATASFTVEDFSTRRIEQVTSADLAERCKLLMGALKVDPIDFGD